MTTTRKKALLRAAVLAGQGNARAARLLVKQHAPVGRVIPAIEARPRAKADHRKI